MIRHYWSVRALFLGDEVKIYKCDRCKKEISYEPIIFQAVNRNETKKEAMAFWGPTGEQYLWKNFELCYECAMNVLRWLAHQENILSESV